MGISPPCKLLRSGDWSQVSFHHPGPVASLELLQWEIHPHCHSFSAKILKVQKVGPKTKEEMYRNGKQLLQKKTSTSFSFEWSLWESSSQQMLVSPGAWNIHWEPTASPSRSFKMGGIKALTPPQPRVLSHLIISVIHRQTYGYQSGKGGWDELVDGQTYRRAYCIAQGTLFRAL